MMIFKQFFIKTMIRLFGAKGFSKMYSATSRSKAYSLFCEKVYGRDLCQANMLDEEQLQQMLVSLNLNSSQSVLDIGCGIGKVGEYISDVMGASYTGIDFAYGAVQEAGERTKDKKERMEFLIGNLNKLEDVVIKKYDAIVLIDTLYFVSDMPGCINKMKTFLRPNGKLVICYTSQNKQVGEALTRAGFIYKEYDYTANEKEIWENTLKVSEELKEDFIKEGNLEIYKGRVAEARGNLKAQENKLISRTMYIASA